jgi:hypothetical protein
MYKRNGYFKYQNDVVSYVQLLFMKLTFQLTKTSYIIDDTQLRTKASFVQKFVSNDGYCFLNWHHILLTNLEYICHYILHII